MLDFFEAGGWGMFPVLFFGMALLIATAAWVARPGERTALWARGFGGLTLLAGLLGVFTGFHTTWTYAAREAEPTRLKLVLLGMSESMNNLTFALGLLVLAGLAAMAGVARMRVERAPAAPAKT